MRLLSSRPTQTQHGPFDRIRFRVILLCALVGGLIAGVSAPSILNNLFRFSNTPVIQQSNPEPTTGEDSVQQAAKQAGPGKASARRPLTSAGQKAVEVPKVVLTDYPQAHSPQGIFAIAALGALLSAWLGNILLLMFGRFVDKWNQMEGGDRVTAVLGVFLGIVVSFPFLAIVQTMPIAGQYGPWIVVALTFGSIALVLYTLQSISEFLPWNKGRGPARRTGLKVLDTNVIIDGRIRDVAQNGFLEGQLYVPQFVLEELQHIADHHDPLKRQRGKRGLDVLRYMQSEMPLEVGARYHLAPDTGDPVDSRLVRLARALGADLVTNDHNLNRVAALQEVKVLNINDLALALRPNVLPQEKLGVKIIRDGNQPGQGIGYLDDGTMIVVEDGHEYINQTVAVEVTQVIQTERGKMIFGEIAEEEDDLPPERVTRRKSGGQKG